MGRHSAGVKCTENIQFAEVLFGEMQLAANREVWFDESGRLEQASR